MSPILKTVEKAGIRGVRKKRSPADVSIRDFFEPVEQLKQMFAQIINVDSPSKIAIIPSVSYGISTVTKNLRLSQGENIVVAAEQFPSNYYPWDRLCANSGATLKIVSAPEGVERGKHWNNRILEAITASTRAVAIGHVHWSDGTMFDLHAIRQRTRAVNSLLIVDGTQSVGALPFDFKSIAPDALICAAYKWLLGPYSIGFACYGDYFAEGEPLEENWINRSGSENFSSLDQYNQIYKPGAGRFSMGEQSNFILVPMALKALEQINRWGVENIRDYISSISRNSIAALSEKGFIIEDESFRAPHMFGIRHSTIALGSDKLQRILKEKKISVSIRGQAMRVSPHVYNHENDLRKLVKALTTGV